MHTLRRQPTAHFCSQRLSLSGSYLLLALTASMMLISTASWAERYKYTYPQPPKIKPADPMRVSPGNEIPEFPDRYSWRLKRSKLSSNSPSDGTVRTFEFDAAGRGRPIGAAPEGTEIKLEQVRRAGRTLYYSLIVDGQQRWISGYDIAPAAYTPPAK